MVQVPQTRPSHASILTGRYPYEHKIRDNYSPPARLREVPTLATLLKARGYTTAAFIGAYPVARTSGLDQGFDVYDDPFGAGENATTRHGGPGAPRRRRWPTRPSRGSRSHGPRPFFTWVHFFDPHAPYEAPAPFGKSFAKSPYDGEVAYADSQLGRLLEWLDQLGAPRADAGGGHLRPWREPRGARRGRAHDLRVRRHPPRAPARLVAGPASRRRRG